MFSLESFLCTELAHAWNGKLVALGFWFFMPPAWKVRQGHLVIGSSICLSVCLSICPSVTCKSSHIYIAVVFITAGKTESMWTMWHIYYTDMKKQYTLYPSLPNMQGLTINWQEAGLHYSKKQTRKKADPLLLTWDPKWDELPDNPVKLNYGGVAVK